MDTDTIRITIPQVKVEIPIKGLTFDILENMIFDMILKIAQIAFSKALADIDTYLRKNRRRAKLKNTGKRKKTLERRFAMYDCKFNKIRIFDVY